MICTLLFFISEFEAGYDCINQFECKRCGKAYKLKTSLYKHLRWECGVEPQFKCSYCPYKGKQKIHYLKHLTSRHKEHAKQFVKLKNKEIDLSN